MKRIDFALEFERLLENGKITTKAALAQKLGSRLKAEKAALTDFHVVRLDSHGHNAPFVLIEKDEVVKPSEEKEVEDE